MSGCVSRDVCELSWFWVGRLAWLRPPFVATSLRSGRRPWGLDHRGGIGTTQESKTPRTGTSQGQSFCVNLIARQSGRPMRRVCVRWNGPAAVWGINQFNRIRPIEQKSRKRKTLVGCVCETRSIDWEAHSRGRRPPRPGCRGSEGSSDRAWAMPALLCRHRADRSSRVRKQSRETQYLVC